MKRNIKKNFWFSAKEDAALKRKAKKCGVTEAALIRMLVTDFVPKEAPPWRFYRELKELNMVCVHLRQLVATANREGYTYTDEIEQVIGQISFFILNIKRHYTLPEYKGKLADLYEEELYEG